jgi:hypothetical protein
VCAGLAYSDSFHSDIATPRGRVEAMERSDRAGAGAAACGQLLRGVSWLKAVKAAGSTNAEAAVAKMNEIPVNDFYSDNVKP